MARPLNDSVFLYGFHDPGGEQIMLDAGVTGWVLITEEIGHDPNDHSGRNYHPFTDRGLGMIVRLNNAYNPGGTLPFERFYPDFARRCANFVAASEGAHLWIIGNETNHPIEWPGAQWNWGPGGPAPISPDTRGEEITPTRYASCFKQCRAAIKAVAGHARDQVLTAPPAPWNILLTYPSNPDGNWVKYFADLLKEIGPGNLDGIVIHTYTHGSSPKLIASEEKLNDPRFSSLHWQFRAYQDFMNAIPAVMRSLPAYITETNQGDEPWLNANNGWVQAAYAEIDRWNRSGKQLIRSLLLYRWPNVPGDRWGIESKAGVIEDFKQALGQRYIWTTAEEAVAALAGRVAELEQTAAALKSESGNTSKLAEDAAALRKERRHWPHRLRPRTRATCTSSLTPSRPRSRRSWRRRQGGHQMKTSSSATVTAQADQIERLRGLLADHTTGQVTKPPVVDKVDTLAHHPTLPPYSQRTQPISMIVVHHTDTPKTMTVEKIAEYHVFGERRNAQGTILKAQWPGIGYHFLVGPDGVITQGQRESTRSYHVGGDPNDFAIAISLIGRFMRKNYDGTERAPEDQAPTPLQLKSAGHLAAWLMQEFNIPLEQVKGHRDVWPKATVCPGEHWKAGLNWYSRLVQEIQCAQAAAGGQSERPIPLYLLFWDHGNAWAEGDWRNAQGYIARFRPTAGFSVDEALLAQRVVIVGGPLGVSAQDEARLKAAGVEVHRMSGRDEADTKRMLDELAQQGTPWPGAAAEALAPPDVMWLVDVGGLDDEVFPDEWTVPDDWRLPEAGLFEDQPQGPLNEPVRRPRRGPSSRRSLI